SHSMVLIAPLGVGLASHTSRADPTIRMRRKGEALPTPFYAARRFAAALGARATRDGVFAVRRSDAVVVLSGWHWSLTRARRAALERWVESGGRLVVD